MKAHKFVAVHGIEKAKAVLEGAPEGSTHFVGSTYLKLIGAVWWNAWLPEWSHKDNCMVKKWKCESIELMKTWGEVYKLDELKRLVESEGIVELLGGIELLKRKIDGKHIGYTHFSINGNGRWTFLDHYIDFIPDSAYHIGMVNKAIADYESIYGGEHV
ncbi:hypothetical protein [Acinetobacter ursingii]|uniref:hypothetical protein n=1 Tax=Acinetobacter ursingii TaxID=108980 RepID=UPI00124FC4B8|nr:hypothetical protein [Acinetobacter ursingii]